MSQSKRSVENEERREAVLCCLQQGMTSREAARHLFVSHTTVNNDRRWLRARAEEMREGMAYLTISIKRTGRIQQIANTTLIQAIQRLEQRCTYPRHADNSTD